MIVGNDISSFQGQPDWATLSKNANFIIAKATEGNGFIDPQYRFNRQNARAFQVPFGSYHFARPELGNTPQDEAKFFCDVIDGDPIQQGELLALDYEINFNDPVTWCLAWLQYVSNHFNGIQPLVYLNQSTAQGYDWSPIINAGFGLWIAAYTYDPNNNNFQTGAWKFASMQQWSDRESVPGIQGTVDADVFFGDVNAFKLYGFQPNTPESPQSPDPCSDVKQQLAVLQQEFNAYKAKYPAVIAIPQVTVNPVSNTSPVTNPNDASNNTVSPIASRNWFSRILTSIERAFSSLTA